MTDDEDIDDIADKDPDDPDGEVTANGSADDEITPVDDAGTPDGTDGDSVAEEPDGADRRRLFVAVISAVVVVVALGAVLAARRNPEQAPATTTTTTVASTTTTIAELPAGTVEVATVRADLDSVTVLSVEPDDWATSDPAAVSEVEMERPPSSHASAPDRPAIPGVEEPVVGRYVVDDGWMFSNPGPLDPPQPTTFLVTERRGRWVQVMIPVRPNGTVGYVDIADVEISRTRTRIEIHLEDHRLVGYDGNDVVVESPIVAGVNFSPTPTGLFYLTDVVPQTNPDGFYGPFVLATNGYSEMLNEFDNGVPVIALHGTNNPALMGQDKSNGCVRVPNEVIARLAQDMPTGTPILIWP